MSWLLGAMHRLTSLDVIAAYGRLLLGVTHALESHHVEHRSTNRAGCSHLISTRTGRCAMAKYSVGAIVQLKTGGIHGYVESLIEPDSEHPKYWCKWDSGSY